MRIVMVFFRLEEGGASGATETSVSILSKQYTASGRNLPEFVRLAYLIWEPSDIDELLKREYPLPIPPFLSNDLEGSPDTGAGHQDAVVRISNY